MVYQNCFYQSDNDVDVGFPQIEEPVRFLSILTNVNLNVTFFICSQHYILFELRQHNGVEHEKTNMYHHR